MTDDDPPPGQGASRPAETPDDSGRDSTPIDNGATTGSDETHREDDDSAHDGVTSTEELLTGARRIERVIRWKWGLGALLTAVVVGAIAGAISVFALEWGPLPGVGVGLLVAMVGVGHVLLLYRSWRYEVRGDALYLERGVITHVKTVVPFVRVQHIDTSRGPIDRLLGLSSLVVYTAGSRGADVTIAGLTPEDAEDLQDRLKLLAKESTGDDAV